MLEYTTETEHGSSSSEASENIEITSYPVEKLENTEYAELLVCVVCLGVPSEPVMTTCSHMFCHNCILHWCKNSGVCPHCHECLDPETDIGPVRMLPLQLWSVLKIKCCFEINGCKETFGLSDTQKNPCKIMRRYAHSKHNSYCQKQENQGLIRNHFLKLTDVM